MTATQPYTVDIGLRARGTRKITRTHTTYVRARDERHAMAVALRWVRLTGSAWYRRQGLVISRALSAEPLATPSLI